MKRIQLFGSGVFSDSAYVTRQRRLNCFFALRKDGDKQHIAVRGTPGLAISLVLPSEPIRGWRSVSDVLYVVAGLTLYKILQNLTVTVAGTLDANSAGLVSISDNNVQLLIVDSIAGYIYTIVAGTYAQSALDAAGSFGKITDANFPNGTNSAAFLDGRLIVAKPNTRQFYVSEYFDGTNWTNVYSLPTYATKDNNSDFLIAISAMNGILTLYGEQSIEFWQNVGTTPLPFGRISGATRNEGLSARHSIAFIDDIQMFLGQNLYGGGSEVTLMQGFNLQRISTDDIEHIINNLSVWRDAVAFGYIIDGHKMFQITFPSVNKSLLYDITSELWSELQTGVALTGRHMANLGITFNSINYVSDATTGSIYQFDDDTHTDNGIPIKRQLTTRHVEKDGNSFAVDELYLDMETGQGLQYGQGSDPQIMLQVSKDGGRTFGIERWKPMGKVGQYKSPRVMWNRMGAGQDFVFQFTMTEPVKFVVIGGAIKIRQEEGSEK